MQSTAIQTKSNAFIQNFGVSLGVITAVFLFIVTLGRMGFLSMEVETAAGGAIVLSADQMAFRQTELRVQAGEPVRLQLNNSDFLPHSLDIDALDVHVPMPVNEQVMATFVPPAPGIYTFYCGVPGHKELGMVGTLIVME